MKPIIVITLVALLSACTTTKSVIVDDSRVVVIAPPKSLFNCPQVGVIPDPKTLTNKQVADFITKLYKYHKTCGINMKQIEKFVEEAKKQYG